MTYQIDQSGKIEQTNRLTSIAVANSRILVLKISAVEKQKLIKTLKEFNRPHTTFIYKIFSALIFILLKNERISQMVIDREYQGHEASIKEMLIQLFQKAGKKIPEIHFDYIGKASLAHKAALEAFRGELKPDIVVEAKEVLKLLYEKTNKNKKGWRPHSK